MSVLRVATLTLLLLASEPALAAEPAARVHLTLPNCALPALSAEQLRAAVALELASSGLALVPEEAHSGTNDIEATLNATCSEHEPLELRAAWGPRDGSRVLELSELPAAARPRAVALVLAELVAALRPEDAVAPIDVELEDETPVRGATPARGDAATPARRAAPRAAAGREVAPDTADGEHDSGAKQPPQSHHAIAVKGEIRTFSLEPVIYGVRVGYEFKRFSLGFSLLHGSAAGQYGSLSTAISYGYFEWRLGEFGRAERPWFSFGPRLGLGLILLTPTPNSGALATSSNDPFVDLAQFCQFWANVGPLRFGTQLEVGYALGAMAYEPGVRLARYGGLFGSALLEAAWLL